MEPTEEMKRMARRLAETPAHVLRGDGTLDLAAVKLTEAADEITALRERVAVLEEALSDPNAVHVNMLRGGIARPSLAQIVHIYGEDALRVHLGER